MNAVALNPNVPFIVKFNTDLLVGALIRSGAGGDPTKEAAKAQLIINVATGINTISTGDVTTGIAQIETAVGTGASDPASQAEIQTVIAYIASKAAAVQEFLSGTLTGALVAQLTQQVCTEATAVASKYLPASAAKK